VINFWDTAADDVTAPADKKYGWISGNVTQRAHIGPRRDHHPGRVVGSGECQEVGPVCFELGEVQPAVEDRGTRGHDNLLAREVLVVFGADDRVLSPGDVDDALSLADPAPMTLYLVGKHEDQLNRVKLELIGDCDRRMYLERRGQRCLPTS